ncbi:MAG: hypothetical protein A3C11_02355 [Candidatus Sungbacteria bacterium RIFCSPHIGHO2_02_FULL_49_12]|uniref:Uncharacterized protein n=1 Tax=Candidatus Sungbacteria bacterium RIFCSPHIGHO2_02_FULL_49_12 TaxID=1802271 RepID=A0A1G2KP77_9BACT|nr:MAG: hypothetical protein A3C11_02355 [Candidatus Sungbacteria bacterium RIFCSPHIGHO2_02_FULL_49_12]
MSEHKNRWFYGGLLIAILNPIFAGLIVGMLLVREPDMRREGMIILSFSFVWGIIVLLLAARYGALKF